MLLGRFLARGHRACRLRLTRFMHHQRLLGIRVEYLWTFMLLLLSAACCLLGQPRRQNGGRKPESLLCYRSTGTQRAPVRQVLTQEYEALQRWTSPAAASGHVVGPRPRLLLVSCWARCCGCQECSALDDTNRDTSHSLLCNLPTARV